MMSQDIRVGDIVYLAGDCEIPCDLVLLGSSEQDGCCFVQVRCLRFVICASRSLLLLQTANIDGETDYKQRRACNDTAYLSEHELRAFSVRSVLCIVTC
jgi:phospholipid-translocating ATPase